MSAARIRLLMVLPQFSLGGADTFNLDLIKQLAARDWRTTVVTTVPSSHPWRALFAAHSDAIFDLSMHPEHERPARLVQIARQHDYDAVMVSNSLFGYHVLPYLRAHLPNTAFVDYNHIEEDWGGGGFPALSVHAQQALDRQIVSSNHLRAWMIARGADPAKVQVATTNIDTNRFSPARYNRAELRAALQLDHAAPVILYAARLARQKQPLLALHVMRDVVWARPKTVFLIAGDGQFAPYVRGFVRAHRLERNIRLLGPQPAERVRELLALSDMFFLPSALEGISLAIYEAMAMSVVPVSADVGGQAELVTPETGVLVQRNEHERAAYTQALLTLVDDERRRHAIGAAARARVEAQFQLDSMGERMLELLEMARQRSTHAPQPTAAEALASARHAIAQAQADAARRIQIDRPLRRWARTLFWRAVERGAWWLVPALERLRWDVD